MPLINANGANDRGSPVTAYHAMAGVPVGAPDTPARLVHEGQAALMRPDHMTSGLVGFMRVRRHSHRHA